MKRRLLLLALPLAGCGDLGMNRQAKLGPQGPAPMFPAHTEAQPPPEGTVALGQPQRDSADAIPPPVTLAFVERGRERYGIACAPCHGIAGAGDGAAPRRGFPVPPPLASPRIAELSGRHIYDVITNGYGVMFPQAERVAPRDRWAVVAYLRALQMASAPEPRS